MMYPATDAFLSYGDSDFRISAERFSRLPYLQVVLIAGLVLFLGLSNHGVAEVFVEDHFMIGENPAAGEYEVPASRGDGQEGSPGGANRGLVWQWAMVPGFMTTEWELDWGEVNPFGMSYPGLATAGGMVSSNPADHGHRIGRSLDTPFTHQTSGTYYMSFLIMVTDDDDDEFGYRSFELHNGGFEDGANRTFQLGVHKTYHDGEPVNGDFGPGDGGWGVRVNNQNSLRFQFEDQESRSPTEANLYVIRFEMSTDPNGDSVTVWRNPTSLGGEEPEGGETLSGFDLVFDRVTFATWQTPFEVNPYQGTVFLDEIRIGSTWAAVTPAGGMPEEGGDFLEYHFVGSLEGWQELTVENINWGPQRWIGQAAIDANRVEGDIPLNPAAAKQYLHRDARWPGGADLAHPTLWMRSPPFQLNGAGDLTFFIMGGGSNPEPNAIVPVHESHVPAMSVDTVDGGFHGVVLRNAETGDFVLVGNRTDDGYDWQQIVFTEGALGAFDQIATYTLDVIDARHNAWAWFNLDTVRIPGTRVDFSPVTDLPTLAIELAVGNQVRLSWPTEAVGWNLQRSFHVGDGYIDADVEVTVEENEFTAYDTISADRQFYRLIQ